MILAYRSVGAKLEKLAPDAPLTEAIWIDLYTPQTPHVDAARALGVDIPTLADMEEIEVSARLYREDGVDYMTVVLPGMSETQEPMSGPVTFILTPERLVTVRHHAPRPFTTYPERADKVGPGCIDPERLFLSLIEEIVGRLADLMEGVGRALDGVATTIYAETSPTDPELLQRALRRVGREGEQIARIRLSLLTIERAVSHFGQGRQEGKHARGLSDAAKGLLRDIHALEVHADHLNARVALSSDATMGMINLSQNQTIKIVSVVAVVFLPPTLIASAYGMNFATMPELDWRFGYPVSIVMMLASAVGTYLFFKWRNWL